MSNTPSFSSEEIELFREHCKNQDRPKSKEQRKRFLEWVRLAFLESSYFEWSPFCKYMEMGASYAKHLGTEIRVDEIASQKRKDFLESHRQEIRNDLAVFAPKFHRAVLNHYEKTLPQIELTRQILTSRMNNIVQILEESQNEAHTHNLGHRAYMESVRQGQVQFNPEDKHAEPFKLEKHGRFWTSVPTDEILRLAGTLERIVDMERSVLNLVKWDIGVEMERIDKQMEAQEGTEFVIEIKGQPSKSLEEHQKQLSNWYDKKEKNENTNNGLPESSDI